MLAPNIENLTLTGYADSDATGNTSNNVLVGNAYRNVLDGGGGADTLLGGAGDDTYVVDSAGDVVVEWSGEGVDLVQSSVTYSLAAELENLTLTGMANIDATGNDLPNVVTGNAGNNVLDGGAGYDTLIGGKGDDSYFVDADNYGDVIVEFAGEGIDSVSSSVDYALSGNVENLTLTGTTALYAGGNGLTNVLVGNTADNVLEGGLGADTMRGGVGNDYYIVDDAGDVVVENANEGTDTVASSVSYVLGSNVENLSLYGASGLSGTGNALANYIAGDVGNDVIDGGTGADTMAGNVGDDTYVVDSASDVIVEFLGAGIDLVLASASYALSANVDNITLTGSAALNATGNGDANLLTGNAANNTLDGGAGIDTMSGGLGNDVYVVDNAGDVVVEAANEGTDLVMSSVDYVLGINLENLTLTGSSVTSGTGNAANNVLIGNGTTNILDGLGGADTMMGGQGGDIYFVDSAADVVIENAGEGTDTVKSSVSLVLANNVENLTLLGTATIDATGNALANTLTGNSANNVLDGGAGADTLSGGLGNDTYVVDNAGDSVTENAGAGTDLVQSSVSYTLGLNLENLTLTGAAAINGTGNALANVIVGNAGANRIDGGTGADSMSGGMGNDTYVVDTAADVVTEFAAGGTDTVETGLSYVLGAEVENLLLTGAAAVNGTGNSLANTLTGNTGNNVLDGGLGADTMIGGAGNDTYVVDSAADVITEAASAGTDLVQSSVTLTLAANVENLTLTGAAAINGTGNTLANALTGNGANNVLDGGTGADTMAGGLGNDTYVVDNAADVVTEAASAGTDTVQTGLTWTLGANLENLTLTGAAAINGTGNALANVITGNAGANRIDGGTGADTMIGAAGNDTYVVDNVGDVTTEVAAAGTDTIEASISWTLATEVENLLLTGAAAINGTGNTLNNTLTGNAADNVLDGGAGVDTMSGGLGNDTYIVDSASDLVTEAAAAGTDLVKAGVTYTLVANVENLTLTGATAINGTGNALANAIIGNGAANRIDGGTGADTMTGGAGNDTYVVDNIGDVTTELAAGGSDTVESSLSWTLATEVENLLLTGAAAINGTGNTLANALTGNGADNVLDGGTGADALAGGLGNDTYLVDNAGDVVTEAAIAGTDLVQSNIGYTLGANLENLTLTGAAAINGTGNALNNVLLGNTGNNRLDGGTGTDAMTGGAGNDTYVVDNVADTTIEIASGGTDTVEAGISWTLAAEVENLILTGASGNSGTGNASNNILTGNVGANVLNGAAGNDTLDGAAGADILIGGTGNDTYVMGRGYGAELIQENDATVGNTDVMSFLAGVTSDQIWFRHVGNDLEVSIIGTADKALVQNWYLGTQYHVEQFTTSDGKTLLDSKVQDLVSAMASFTPPAIGQTTLPASYQTTLLPVIGADWGP